MEIEENAPEEPSDADAESTHEIKTQPDERAADIDPENAQEELQDAQAAPVTVNGALDDEADADTLPGADSTQPTEETDALASTEQSMPGTPDADAPAPTRVGKRRYTRWFQIAALVLLICVIGGIVLTVRAQQGTPGAGKVAHATPTPIPPLKVTNWCATQGAQVDTQASQVSLNKVAALSANDAWLLGSTGKGNSLSGNDGRDFPLIEHWNGKTWSIVPTADTSALLKQLQNKVGGGQVSEDVELSEMAALSSTNIWAVGGVSASKTSQVTLPGIPVPAVQVKAAGQPLIEHWDGKAWQIVASPAGANYPQGPFGSTNRLTGISAISANDIWAVGTQATKTNVPQSGNSFFFMEAAPLVEHWDGTSWTEKKLPDSLQKEGFSPSNIHALATNDVWSFNTGSSFAFTGPITIKRFLPGTPPPGSINSLPIAGTPIAINTQSLASPHILHWNGENWSEMQLSSDLSKHTDLQDVAVIADNDIWAVGMHTDPKAKQDDDTNVIYHWDGSAWKSVSGAPGVDTKSILENIAVIAPNNLWLMGRTSKNQPLMEHWDGKTWQVVSPASPAYGSATSITIAGQRAWALVDVYSTPDTKNTQPFELPDTVGSQLETNC